MMTLSTILKPKKLERSPTLFDPREHDQIHFLGDGTVEIIRDGKVVCTGHCDYTPEPKPLQKRGAPSPEAEKKSGSSNADLPPGARWITVRPNGEGTKGVPLLIREHPDGSASVIAGAGGNLNFLKLGKLKSPEEWKQAARERAADKKRKEAERVAAQSEEEQAAEVEQKEQQQEYHSTKKHENALATIAALDEHGIDHGLTDAHKNALANPPAPGADKAEVDEWKKLTREAGRRIKDIHRAYEHKLVVDADARAAARMGDAPLVGNGNLIVENQAHLACNSGGETLAQLQQLPNGQWLARGSGDGPGKVYDNWAAAAREHVRNTAEAESDQGGDRTQDDTFYDPSQWVKQVKDETLPEGFEFKVGAAAAIAQLSQERKDLDKQKKDAEAAIARGEAWQSIKGGYDAGPVRDALDKIDADAKTLQDAVTNDDFLSLVDSAGDGEKLRRHVQVGGYGKLSEIASDILKVNPVSRALIDALGHNEGAKLVAYQIRQALDPMEYDRVVQAQAAYHADTSTKVAAATQKQVEPMLENLRSLHDQMLALEEKAGDSPTPEQQIQIDTLAYDAETLHENIQQTLGIALGQLQASAAMVAALEAKPNTLRFNNSDGTSAAVAGVVSAKVRADAGKDPTGEDSVFDSYGLTPEDYHHFEGPDGKRLQINESGLKKLAVGYNSEDAEAYERAIAIKRGEMDEAHFVPNGFAYRMESTFTDGVTESMQFNTKLKLKEGMSDEHVEQALQSYIGARVANGNNPLSVMDDVRSPQFYLDMDLEPYGEVALQTQKIASDMISRLAGGNRISDKAVIQAFEALGEAEVIKQRRAQKTDDLHSLKQQKLDHDVAIEAGHRALAVMPMARVLFKSWEATTGKERQWLRDHAISKILGQELEPRKPRKKPGDKEIAAPLSDVSDEQYDLFGNPISAAEATFNPDAEVDTRNDTQWQAFSKFMGSDQKAYDAVKDHLRGEFNHRFANAYGAIADKPLMIGGQKIANVERLLLAKLPEDKQKEMLSFIRARQQSDVAKARTRVNGKFVSEIDDEWTAKYEELKGDNRQISLLTADAGRSSTVDFHRTTLGTEAEDNLHRAMQQVIPSFDQINGPIDIIPEVNWSGGTAHATKQRALKFLEANKRMWLHFAAGCVHGSTMLQCVKTGIEQPFEDWWFSGDRPWVKALDQSSGQIVTVEASQVFVKGFDPMYKVTCDNGNSIIVTGDHQFLCDRGWTKLKDLQAGDLIAALRQTVHAHCESSADFSRFETTWLDVQRQIPDRASHLATLFSGAHESLPYAPLSMQAALREHSLSALFPLPSSLGLSRSTRLSSVLRWKHKALNSQVNYSACSRPYGEQLQSAQDSVPEPPPSQGGVLSRIQHYSQAGDCSCLRGQVHTLTCQRSFHRSTTSSTRQPALQAGGAEYRNASGNSQWTIWSRQTFVQSDLPTSFHPSKGVSTLPGLRKGFVHVLSAPTRHPCFDISRSPSEPDELSPLRPQIPSRSKVSSFHRQNTCGLPIPGQSHTFSYSKILKIQEVGSSLVFDITVPRYENYIAHGMVNHNSGKSAILIGQFTHLHSKGLVKKMVVAVPSSIIGQFNAEIASFTNPGTYNHNANLGMSREQRLEALRDPDNHIHVTTRESLSNDILHLVEKHHGITTEQFQNDHSADSRKDLINQALRKEGIDPDHLMLGVDEAHDLLSATGEDTSNRSMILGALGHNTPYSVFATGSPMKNNIDEVYHALHMVAPSKFNDKAKFKAEYGANTDVSRRALQRAIAPYMYAAGTKPKDKSGRTLKMNEKQPKIPVNDHISKGRAAILEDTKTVGAYLSARTKDLKAQGITPTTEHYNEAWNDPAVRAAVGRLASGDTWGKMTEDQQKAAIGGQIRAVGAMKMSAMYRLFHRAPFEDNPKAQWTVDKAVEMVKAGKPGAVFSKSSQAAKMLRDEMVKKGLRVGVIDGSLSSVQKDAVRSDFVGGKYDFLVLTDAAQTGVNLVGAKELVMYDVPETQKAYEQRSARIHRLKQDVDTVIHTPMLDLPEERIAWARVQRKAKTGNPLQSKAELVDDSGLASRIAQMRSAA
jgi:hypothetical protein